MKEPNWLESTQIISNHMHIVLAIGYMCRKHLRNKDGEEAQKSSSDHYKSNNN